MGGGGDGVVCYLPAGAGKFAGGEGAFHRADVEESSDVCADRGVLVARAGAREVGAAHDNRWGAVWPASDGAGDSGRWGIGDGGAAAGADRSSAEGAGLMDAVTKTRLFGTTHAFDSGVVRFLACGLAGLLLITPVMIALVPVRGESGA